MSTMNLAVKAKWIAALREGRFKRGRYQMRDVDGHCDVLGVLCELAVEEGVIPKPRQILDKEDGRLFYGYQYGAENASVGIPVEVVEWSGLEYRRAYSLAVKCDGMKKWNEMADYIEAYL